MDDVCWYLVASKPKQEFRAVEQLENQGIKAYSPSVKVEKIVRGKAKIITEALFAGYLFVHLSNQSPLWHKVRSTRGVRDWIRFAGEVATIPTNLVEKLVTVDEEPEHQIVINRFREGQSVRILSGPFVGLEGVFDKSDGESRAMVLVEFLGQSNRLAVSNEQITTT